MWAACELEELPDFGVLSGHVSMLNGQLYPHDTSLQRRTLFQCRRGGLRRKGRLLKRAPFEVFLVATAVDLTFMTLLTGRFGLVALQPLRFAGHTTWTPCQRPVYVGAEGALLGYIPLRLFDCFGLGVPSLFTVAALAFGPDN